LNRIILLEVNGIPRYGTQRAWQIGIRLFPMKLGGTTDIKFVRPKQTRHLFCLGRFCILRGLNPGTWNMNSTFAEPTATFLLYSLVNLNKHISVDCDLVENI